MNKYRISNYGMFDHIYDVEVKKWYGWVLVKRFKIGVSRHGGLFIYDANDIEYAGRCAVELLEKLEEEI